MISRPVMSGSLWPHGLHHARLPSFAVSWGLLRLTSSESVMPSNQLVCCLYMSIQNALSLAYILTAAQSRACSLSPWVCFCSVGPLYHFFFFLDPTYEGCHTSPSLAQQYSWLRNHKFFLFFCLINLLCDSFSLKIFLIWTIFKVSIEFVMLLLLFCVLLYWPRGMWDS